MSALMATVVEAPMSELVSHTSATFSKNSGAAEWDVVAHSGGVSSDRSLFSCVCAPPRAPIPWTAPSLMRWIDVA